MTIPGLARLKAATLPQKIVVGAIVVLILYAGIAWAGGRLWVHRVAGKALHDIADVLHKADVVDQKAAEHQGAIDSLGLAINNLARERDEALKAQQAAEARAALAGAIVATKSQERVQVQAQRRALKPVLTLEEARDVLAAAIR